MALYQIDRPRTTSFIGKFKFNYQVTFGKAEVGSPKIGQAFFETDAGVRFTINDNDGLVALVGVCSKGGNLESLFNYPDRLPDYGPNDYDSQTKESIVRLGYELIPGKPDVPQRDYIEIDRVKFIPTEGVSVSVSGTVEGYVYWGAVANEFVDIQEYYPSKDYFVGSSVCPDNENQYWYQEDLNEQTVRHWPKYTTINWFEAPDRTKKAVMGIYVKVTTSKNKQTIINRSWTINAPLFIGYTVRKELNAWTGFISNSGYVSVSSNIPNSSSEKNISAQTKSAKIDNENFSLSPVSSDPSLTPKSFVTMNLLTEASRKVSFNSLITDWDKTHTDKLTAYIVGFGCTGLLDYYSVPGSPPIPYAVPTYEKVETNSGDISPGDQTYRYYSGTISAHTINDYLFIPDEYDSKSVLLDTRQKWIYGMIDGQSEKFDDLESPPKDYDYPQYWVRSANGCRDINEFPRLRTLDETDLPSGYLSIPIPLKGWKFNAMTLKQNKEYVLSSNGSVEGFGLTNTLNFLGTKAEPYYYLSLIHI